MKKISLVVAAFLIVTGNVLANGYVEGVKPKNNISAQISKMLSKGKFTKGTSAQVRFTLNNVGEIVVLSVDSDSEQFESFVKSKLNYKKIELDKVEEGKLYTIPVRVEA
ncbi:hypothetical protein [Maribacter sp. 2210JD10-5]|uniref:hypothetical protein n=1 Tax=Maribacter sp. 2210JD10-5 TaxID=3386272 RepID=UPI0039BC8E61